MATDTILHLGTDDFDQEVLHSDVPVLVDFLADWCQPCHALAPTIEQIAETYDGRIKVAKVDIDAAKDLAVTYGITSIPAVVLFKDGQPIRQLVGVRPYQEYATALDDLLD